MADARDRHLLLGVTGGIAAYKACELVSRATKIGWEVRVVMTPGATRFVGPLTFEALTNHPVMTDALASGHTGGAGSVEHIAWAKWARVALVAPCTANTLARLACGLADEALSTVFLALPGDVPVLVAPAMNTQMWLNPITQRNVGWLESTGRHRIVPPTEKRLVCGDIGVGGLAEVDDLLAAVEAAYSSV